jgi:hypothetical protein
MEVSMEAAAVLLSLAMRDTEDPVADLCGALRRIGRSLNELRAGPASLPAATNGDGDLRKRLEKDVAVCIESLQFHDRLIQQLAAVRGLLASVVNDSPPELKGFGAHRWEDMLSMLRDQLNEDSQHHLFNLLLRTGIVIGDGQRNLQAEEGSVDLF